MAALFLAPLYILINAYVVRWMIRWMGAWHRLFQTMAFRASFIGVYIILATALLTGFLIKKPANLHRILKHTGNYFLGTFIYILLVIAVVDFGRLILKYIFHAPFIGHRSTFVITGLICTILIISLSVYGILHVTHVKTTPYKINVEKTVDGMDSLKIVLLADTHFGYSMGTAQAKRIVKKINTENPDVVCIAGDIFDNEYDAISKPDELKEILRGIKSRYGVYACWGNHDLNEEILAGFTFKHKDGDLSDIKDPRMKKFLEDSNIHILEDESVLINDQFYVIGRKDASLTEKIHETRKAPAQLTEKLDRDKPIIMIDHQPKELQELADAGVDLDLCGHTHNGQTFPGNFTIKLMWENPCGLLSKDNMTNITTSGAGVWGPAMRIGTDSEICSINIQLKKA